MKIRFSIFIGSLASASFITSFYILLTQPEPTAFENDRFFALLFVSGLALTALFMKFWNDGTMETETAEPEDSDMY